MIFLGVYAKAIKMASFDAVVVIWPSLDPLSLIFCLSFSFSILQLYLCLNIIIKKLDSWVKAPLILHLSIHPQNPFNKTHVKSNSIVQT